MNIDQRLEARTTGLEQLKERHEALTMNLELAHRDILELKVLAQKDGENIRRSPALDGSAETS